MREVLIVSPLGENSVKTYCEADENEPVLYVSNRALEALDKVFDVGVIYPPDELWEQPKAPTEIYQEFLYSILKEFKDFYYVIIVAIDKKRIDSFLDCVNNFNQHNERELNLIVCNFEKDRKQALKKNMFILEQTPEEDWMIINYFNDGELEQEESFFKKPEEIEISDMDIQEAIKTGDYSKFSSMQLDQLMKKFNVDENYEQAVKVRDENNKRSGIR